MRRVAGFAATAERRDKLDGDIGHSHPGLRQLFYIILFRSVNFVQEHHIVRQNII